MCRWHIFGLCVFVPHTFFLGIKLKNITILASVHPMDEKQALKHCGGDVILNNGRPIPGWTESNRGNTMFKSPMYFKDHLLNGVKCLPGKFKKGYDTNNLPSPHPRGSSAPCAVPPVLMNLS